MDSVSTLLKRRNRLSDSRLTLINLASALHLLVICVIFTLYVSKGIVSSSSPEISHRGFPLLHAPRGLEI